MIHIIRFLLVLIFSLLQGVAQELATEELNLTNGDIALPGTLTYPKSGKAPLVIYVHGSGNVDRNGNQGAIVRPAYIQQLADSLNQHGIAFYRYDKRTSTPENLPKLRNMRLQHYVDDLKIAIAHFQDDVRFPSIHLIGHSQGSLVAMLAQDDGIASYISIAGPASTIKKTIIEQIRSQSPPLAEVARVHFEELEKTDTILQVDPLLISIFAPQNQRFIKDWMHYSPVDEIQKVTIATLIINGDQDLQVNTEEAKSLHRVCKNCELVIVPQMNHVLKTVDNTQNNHESYYDSGYPLSTGLVATVSAFIKTHQ